MWVWTNAVLKGYQAFMYVVSLKRILLRETCTLWNCVWKLLIGHYKSQWSFTKYGKNFKFGYRGGVREVHTPLEFPEKVKKGQFHEINTQIWRKCTPWSKRACATPVWISILYVWFENIHHRNYGAILFLNKCCKIVQHS